MIRPRYVRLFGPRRFKRLVVRPGVILDLTKNVPSAPRHGPIVIEQCVLMPNSSFLDPYRTAEFPNAICLTGAVESVGLDFGPRLFP